MRSGGSGADELGRVDRYAFLRRGSWCTDLLLRLLRRFSKRSQIVSVDQRLRCVWSMRLVLGKLKGWCKTLLIWVRGFGDLKSTYESEMRLRPTTIEGSYA